MSGLDLFQVLEATWPPARRLEFDQIVIRLGDGGKRVGSTYFLRDDPALVDKARELRREIGGVDLYHIRPDQVRIDSKLGEMGYQTVDPTLIFLRPLAGFQVDTPPVTAFPIWPPLGIMRDIWRSGGIDEDRIAVMNRAGEPKTGLLGRMNNHAAGVAFVAICERIAMMHALEVSPPFRRMGLARHLTSAAMLWAKENGAGQFALAVTERNSAARGLYTALGMKVAERYHYRVNPERQI